MVCQELLGKFLVIKKKWKVSKYIITEVEAYDGEQDEACHARHGKTERNAPMYATPGCRYVYMIYGMYYMLNIVTGPGKHPSAILLRGLNAETTKRWNDVQLNGPGKLTKALWIDKSFNGKKADEKVWLRIEESWIVISNIKTAPRVGIDYASPEWRNKHWRFYADDFWW
jgi:DNA-3-methyladenine glycosylase